LHKRWRVITTLPRALTRVLVGSALTTLFSFATTAHQHQRHGCSSPPVMHARDLQHPACRASSTDLCCQCTVQSHRVAPHRLGKRRFQGPDRLRSGRILTRPPTRARRHFKAYRSSSVPLCLYHVRPSEIVHSVTLRVFGHESNGRLRLCLNDEEKKVSSISPGTVVATERSPRKLISSVLLYDMKYQTNWSMSGIGSPRPFTYSCHSSRTHALQAEQRVGVC